MAHEQAHRRHNVQAAVCSGHTTPESEGVWPGSVRCADMVRSRSRGGEGGSPAKKEFLGSPQWPIPILPRGVNPFQSLGVSSASEVGGGKTSSGRWFFPSESMHGEVEHTGHQSIQMR